MKTAATAHYGAFVEESMASPSYQAYQILHWAFVIAPLLAGVDKFFDRLVDWSMYLWTPLGKLVGGDTAFMRIAGGIEIAAAGLVAFKPKIGAPIVAAWLAGIIVSLLLKHNFYDIALRDLGLFLGALALWRLAVQFDTAHSERMDS